MAALRYTATSRLASIGSLIFNDTITAGGARNIGQLNNRRHLDIVRVKEIPQF